MFARAWTETRGRRREGDEACTLMHIGIEAAGRTWDTTYETAQLHESYLAAKSDDARYAVVEEYIVEITIDFEDRVNGAFPSRPAICLCAAACNPGVLTAQTWTPLRGACATRQ